MDLEEYEISEEYMLTDDEKQLVKMYVNGDDVRFSGIVGMGHIRSF